MGWILLILLLLFIGVPIVDVIVYLITWLCKIFLYIGYLIASIPSLFKK